MTLYVVMKDVETLDYRYEDAVVNNSHPVFACASKEAAKRWIDEHPLKAITESTWYGEVELEDEYYIEEIQYFPGENIDFEDEHEEDDYE